MNNPFEKKKNNELDEMEKKVLRELRVFLKKPFFKADEILQWSASELDCLDGTRVVYLPGVKIYVEIEE